MWIDSVFGSSRRGNKDNEEWPFDSRDDGLEYEDDNPEENDMQLSHKRNPPILEAPRKKEMNEDNRDDFVAIDFETMTAIKTSACAIGMVKVLDGEIMGRYYSVINPIRDQYIDKEPNRVIHGISLATAEKAPTFAEIFGEIRAFIGDLPLVCHNRGADIPILRKLMIYFGLSGINTENVFCTYEATGLSLVKCCEQYGISASAHHNALCDAEMCARIYLELIGKPIFSVGGKPVFNRAPTALKGREIKKEHCSKLEKSEVSNPNTIFFDSSVVITGVFESYPERDGLAAKLQSLGAKVNKSISKKTKYVIVGSNAGPKKLDKIKELQEEGYDIRILREHELATHIGDN